MKLLPMNPQPPVTRIEDITFLSSNPKDQSTVPHNGPRRDVPQRTSARPSPVCCIKRDRSTIVKSPESIPREKRRRATPRLVDILEQRAPAVKRSRPCPPRAPPAPCFANR